MVKRIYRFINKRLKLEYRKFLNSDFYLKHFHRAKVEKLACEVRCKPLIRVAFVLHDISKWKTESLYLAMKEHPRFEPILITTVVTIYSYLSSSRIYCKLIDTLESKGYNYIQSLKEGSILEKVSPDIVFLQEPYQSVVPIADSYSPLNPYLYCYVNYGFHNIVMPSLVNEPIHNHAWQLYMENEHVSNEIASCMTNGGVNNIVTGLPFSDSFMKPIDTIPDPWRSQSSNVKRIIWAPHHSFSANYNPFYQSTFLEIADAMLELAKKYEGRVHWAFKPHPFLYQKLIEFWGAAKTNEYYNKWRELECAQVEEGEYIGLFMHSDAMIHDCSSFIVEYHYTHKPVFFIQNGKETFKDYSEYSKMAYDLHYKGSTIEDIERFINEVVLQGNDPMHAAREQFFNEYLLPPNGKSASENIIDAILGE